MQEWVEVQEFPGYSVSYRGMIRNDKYDRLLTPVSTRGDHLFVGMVRDGKQWKRSVSRIVCEAYLPQPEDHFNTPIHFDGAFQNCHLDNLDWRPRWFAHQFTRQYSESWRPIDKVRDRRTSQVFRNVWDLVAQRGLLVADIIRSANTGSYVFPTKDVFEWD